MSKKGKGSQVQFDESQIKEESIVDDSNQQEYDEDFDLGNDGQDDKKIEESSIKHTDNNIESSYKQSNFDIDQDDDEDNKKQNQSNNDEEFLQGNGGTSNTNVKKKSNKNISNEEDNFELSQSKKENEQSETNILNDLPQVEYRKNNYLLYLREVNGGKFIQQKEKARQADGHNQYKTLIYYRLGDKNWIEARLRSIIEVPFERNQTEEEIELKLITIDEETEVQVKQKFKLHELSLTKEKSCDTFVCRFDSRNGIDIGINNTYFKFVLVFDATILAYAEGLSEKGNESNKDKKDNKNNKLLKNVSSPTSSSNSFQVTVFSFTLRDILGYHEFVKIRRNQLKDQMILNTSTNWFCRYLLEITFAKQKCQIYLDDEERDDIYLFYSKLMGNIKIQLIEQVYETYQLDDYGKVTYKETKLKSSSPIENAKDINVQDVIGKGKGYEQYEEKYKNTLTLKYNLSLIPQKTQFHNKFLGYTSIKILETAVFNEMKQPTHMEISLYSMDNELINQIWRLKPLSHYSQNVSTISTWDYQHDLVYKKNSQDADDNIDVLIPEQLFNKILQIEMKAAINKLEGDYPLDEDFRILIKNYQHLMSYDPILEDPTNQSRDLQFSQKNNHIFFKTSCPFDYISIKIYCGDPRKASNLIGVYEESFFKVPENALILAYIYQDKDGRVDNAFNQVSAKNNLSSNKQDILDNDKNDDVIGTIKFTVDHFGYNKLLIEESSSWVKEIQNYKEDSDQLIQEIKSSTKNYVTKKQSILTLRLSLSEIWNLSDLIEQTIPLNVKSEAYDLRIKIGNISYAIRLSVSRIEKKNFKKPEIIYKLEKENTRGYVERVNDKMICYSRTDDYIIQTIADTDISSSLIFQVSSTLESLIIELRTISSNEEVLAFYSEQIKNISFCDVEGFFIMGMIIPDKNRRYQNNTFNCQDSLQKLQIFNNTVYFKFNYEFLEDSNYDVEINDQSNGLYTLGIFLPAQQKLTKDKQKLLKQFVYLVSIHEPTTDKKYEQNIAFTNSKPKFTIDYFKKFEFNKSGDLFFTVRVKKIYSGDIEEDEEDAEYIFERQYHINSNQSSRIDGYNKDIKLIKMKLQHNKFCLIDCKFYDDTINQELFFNLQLNYKWNYFIDYPQQIISLSIPYGLEQKMVTSDILDSNASITIKLSSLSKEALKYKKNSQEQIVTFGEKKKNQEQEINFESYDFRDNIVLMIYSGLELMDTGIAKISDLILLDSNKIQEEYSNHKIELSQQLDESNLNISSTSMKKKKLNSKSMALPPSSDYLWTFINFCNKRFEFYIRMKDRVPRNEKSLISQNKEQQSLNQSKKDINQSKLGKGNNVNNITNQLEKKDYDVYTLKKMIKEKENENMLLKTELNKYLKEHVKQKNAILELEDIQRRSNAKTMDSTKPKRTTAPIVLSEEANKAKILFQSICQCGASNPKFKGFCENCIENMKNEYKLKYDAYKIIADKYEGLYTKNLNTDTKIIKMKKKIESLQQEAAFVDNEQSNQSNGDEKLLIEEINYMKQNIKCIASEIKMMQNDSQRVISQKYNLQNTLEEKIAKKIQKITKLNQEAAEFKKRRLDLEEKIDEMNKKFVQQRENI